MREMSFILNLGLVAARAPACFIISPKLPRVPVGGLTLCVCLSAAFCCFPLCLPE